MPQLVLDLLKYALLAVLYIFVARVVKAIYMELRPPTPRRASPRPTSSARPPPRRPRKAPRHVVIVEGDSLAGKAFDLSQELVVGRADKCHIVLQDNYVSQVHARIFARGESFMVEDLGSTNGTYLNRRRITSPSELQRGDRIKIGKTVMELRK